MGEKLKPQEEAESVLVIPSTEEIEDVAKKERGVESAGLAEELSTDSVFNLPTEEKEFNKWSEEKVYRKHRNKKLINKTIDKLGRREFYRLQKASRMVQELEQKGLLGNRNDEPIEHDALGLWFNSNWGKNIIRDVPEEFASGGYREFIKKASIRRRMFGDKFFTGKGGAIHFLLSVEAAVKGNSELYKEIKRKIKGPEEKPEEEEVKISNVGPSWARDTENLIISGASKLSKDDLARHLGEKYEEIGGYMLEFEEARDRQPIVEAVRKIKDVQKMVQESDKADKRLRELAFLAITIGEITRVIKRADQGKSPIITDAETYKKYEDYLKDLEGKYKNSMESSKK